MSILSWIVVGGLAGWIASRFMGVQRQGCFTNIIVGIIGAFLGGLLVSLLGGIGVTGFDLRSLVVAVVGAVLFIGLLNKLKK